MLKLITSSVEDIDGDLLVIPVCEDHALYRATTVIALIDAARATGDFKGSNKDALMLYGNSGVRFPRVLFIGMGKAGALSAESFRIAAGTAVKQAMAANLSTAIMAVSDQPPNGIDRDTVFDATSEGAALANHVLDRYKKEKKTAPLSSLGIMAGGGAAARLRKRLARISAIVGGARQAREWVSLPSNDKTPGDLADMMADAARKAGLKVTTFTEKTLKSKGFGAILAVGAGSHNPSRLLVLEYAPKKPAKTIALVGKGITFDSGGINLKPSTGLDEMKSDMAGAAAVAGTLLAVAALKPKHRVVGVMPLVENMPSGSALRPGDIIRTYAGKTVEVGNTDAEGRLVLADALAWAIDTYRPDAVIDLATLTGACVVALGEKLAGVFTPVDDLATLLLDAAAATGERCWRMPLPEDYAELLKSELADINNMSSTRYGGAITAALFLKSFVGETCWAHVDIAGPAYLKKPSAYGPAGGTGFGVRLLCSVLAAL
ncbi:MAG: leucyl aminopeptidase [Pseudomonadota bacterium]